MTAAQRAVAELKALFKDRPELFNVAAGGECHVGQVDRDDALIEAAVILVLAGNIVAGIRDVADARVGEAVRRQEAAAAHAGIHIALELEHLLFADVIGHHAARRALGGELCEVIIRRVVVNVVLFEHVDELGEGGRDPHALLVFDALIALLEHFLDDDGKVALFLLASRLVEVHENGDERCLTVRGQKRHDLILDGLHAALDLLTQTALHHFGDLGLIRGNAKLADLDFDLTADFLAGDLHERREVCEADALTAVLVTCNLRDDLRGDVAGGGEAVRLFNERAGDDRAVLQHVFEVYEVAVVHVLREIVHIMEMDDALLVCFDDFARKQNAARDVFGDLAGHVIALDAVYGWIFIRVFLLGFLVVALDKAENLVIGGIGAARKRTRIAVTDILLSDIERTLPHDLLFYEVLYFFHGRCTPHGDARSFDICSNCANLLVRKSLTLVDLFICLGDSDDNLSDIERCFRAVSLNDLHVPYRSFIPPAGAACFQPLWFS